MKEIKVAGILERDIDLLLMEEFITSSSFCRWFLSQINFPLTEKCTVNKVERGVTDSTGESDLEISLETSDGHLHKILIENKIKANFQSKQVERYRERGKNYILNTAVSGFTTVLVAPESYSNSSRNGFDAKVTYEDISDWFSRQVEAEERIRYKLYLLREAIEKGKLGYQMIADAPVTNFWVGYWSILQEIAPQLGMEQPGNKPAGAKFIYFRKNDLPKGVDLVHKLGQGVVDLQFSGMGNRISELKERYGKLLLPSMHITGANKSGVIRHVVPIISVANNFEVQMGHIQTGITTASNMLSWFREAEKCLGITSFMPP